MPTTSRNRALLALALTLVALLMIGLAWAPGRAQAQTATLPEFTNYTKAGTRTLGYVQLFKARDEKVNGAALVKGVDWSGRLYVDGAAWPSNVSLAWNVPNYAPPSGGVWGYLHLKTGQAEGAQPAVKSPIKPFGQINSLAYTVDIQIMGPGGFNVLSDTFGYKDATLDAGGKAFELGVFHHIADNQRAWAMGQPCIRTCEPIPDRAGRLWYGRVAGALYYMYLPVKGDYLSGVFDLKEFLDHAGGGPLTTAGTATMGGTSIGIEPVNGGGFATLKSYTPPVW